MKLSKYQEIKLLDTGGGNLKLEKTNKRDLGIRVAGLSLYPDNVLCPASKAAGCSETCLASAGRGVFRPVREARQRKADYFYDHQEQFLLHLERELFNFESVCSKAGVLPVVRLNVLSDVCWESLGIIEKFGDVFFLDYTKRVRRLGNTPENYRLIFSYSGKPTYRGQVVEALKHQEPIAVVFRNKMPSRVLGREVVDGDLSDYENVRAGSVVLGLRAKGSARYDYSSGFVVDAP